MIAYQRLTRLYDTIMVGMIILTGNRAQHIWNKDFHQSLVKDVVTAPHPESNRFIFTESHQLLSGDRTLHLIITTQKSKYTITLTSKTLILKTSFLGSKCCSKGRPVVNGGVSVARWRC